MRAYLETVGGASWLDMREDTRESMNDGELLAEFGGRMCYRSWEPGLNPNVTRIRTDQREYFANVLRSAHGSVLEHANYCSRSATSHACSPTSLFGIAPVRPSARRACATSASPTSASGCPRRSSRCATR